MHQQASGIAENGLTFKKIYSQQPGVRIDGTLPRHRTIERISKRIKVSTLAIISMTVTRSIYFSLASLNYDHSNVIPGRDFVLFFFF